MNKHKLLERIYNNQKNVNFNDFRLPVGAFGFEEVRIRGSHHIYAREGVYDMVNIQNGKGQAKPYQVKQFLNLVEIYNLKMEEQACTTSISFTAKRTAALSPIYPI